MFKLCVSRLCLSSITGKQSALSGAGGEIRFTLNSALMNEHARLKLVQEDSVVHMLVKLCCVFNNDINGYYMHALDACSLVHQFSICVQHRAIPKKRN